MDPASADFCGPITQSNSSSSCALLSVMLLLLFAAATAATLVLHSWPPRAPPAHSQAGVVDAENGVVPPALPVRALPLLQCCIPVPALQFLSVYQLYCVLARQQHCFKSNTYLNLFRHSSPLCSSHHSAGKASWLGHLGRCGRVWGHTCVPSRYVVEGVLPLRCVRVSLPCATSLHAPVHAELAAHNVWEMYKCGCYGGAV